MLKINLLVDSNILMQMMMIMLMNDENMIKVPRTDDEHFIFNTGSTQTTINIKSLKRQIFSFFFVSSHFFYVT